MYPIMVEIHEFAKARHGQKRTFVQMNDHLSPQMLQKQLFTYM